MKAVRPLIRSAYLHAQSIDGIPDERQDFRPDEDQVVVARLAAAWDEFHAKLSDP